MVVLLGVVSFTRSNQGELNGLKYETDMNFMLWASVFISQPNRTPMEDNMLIRALYPHIQNTNQYIF